ncbi:alkaline ceramidase 3-like [Amphiura filiformis]|uniref:alkaline ceramidase 3-like n=1 Tax=Amphiura filiformis TaxID=82378 RepID=UPI003B227365
MDTQYEHTQSFWGDRTASIDWCEENYVMSKYIAEFWNTLSNLAIIIPACVGLRQALKDDTEKRFVCGYLMLLVVGCGSWLFHMTLLYTMQMCDEVPMLWGVAVFTYCLWESRAPLESFNKRLAASQLLVTCAVTGVCATTRDPRIFPLCFGAFVLVLTIQCIIAVRNQKCDPRLMKMALIIYFIGSVMWIIDRNQCQLLSHVRNVFPPAIQPLLQLHGWWHVFAGSASSTIILFIYDIRCRELKYPYKIGWKWYCIPYMKVNTKMRKEV